MALDATAIVKTFLATGSLPLSRSISQVQTMLSRADYDACDLAEHLRVDPTLAARVMSVANSAFFSRSPCGSIDDAVNRLGTVQLTRIFAQVLANATMVLPLKGYGMQADAIWRRSIVAAVGAEMATKRKGGDCSVAYMVGLLHLVGMYVINNFWSIQPGNREKINFVDFDQEWVADERKLCRFDHASVGAELMRQLAFPETVADAIGGQYRPPGESLGAALYIGRYVRSFMCDKVALTPNQEILREFDISTDSERETFIEDVRQEALTLMQAA
jgi:HD-like signal output (HDOD) protein